MSRFSLDQIPNAPGVYALYHHDRCLFVGSAEDLRRRAERNLAGSGPREESGLPPGAVQIEDVTEICWWEHAAFSDPARREAAWELAIQALAPAHRPRFSLSRDGEKALEDHAFAKEMGRLFAGTPSGVFIPQTLDALARTILKLEEKVEALEKQLVAGS